MCTVVSVDGVEIETVSELAAALGVDWSLISGFGPDYCLCGVDLVSLGFRRTTNDEGFPFPEYILDRKK